MTDAPAPSEQAPAKAPALTAGTSMGAILPQTFEEVGRFAKFILASGMAPSDKKTPEQIGVAIMQVREVGLTPLQAINDIAVINGRPTIWGDALIALVRRHGHQVHERIEGEGDQRVAICTVRRADTHEEIARTFSVADAKKANLWGKKGPWDTYPRRMLQMRARSWAIRDGCSDAIKGLHCAEEERDIHPMRDVTPEKNAGVDRAKQLREANRNAAPPPEPEDIPQEPEVIEGEIDIPINESHPAFKEGAKAFEDFGPSASPPSEYPDGSVDLENWKAGFNKMAEEAKDADG